MAGEARVAHVRRGLEHAVVAGHDAHEELVVRRAVAMAGVHGASGWLAGWLAVPRRVHNCVADAAPSCRGEIRAAAACESALELEEGTALTVYACAGNCELSRIQTFVHSWRLSNPKLGVRAI